MLGVVRFGAVAAFGLALVLALGPTHIERAAAAGGIVGEPAPKWDIETWFNLPEGKDALEISDFRGKVLLLFNYQSW